MRTSLYMTVSMTDRNCKDHTSAMQRPVFAVHLLLLMSIGPARGHAQPDSLYTDTPAVLELDESSFGPTVYNDAYQRAFFVQFYKPTCGHCRQFAPTYKALAQSIADWRTSVQLVVVSCGNNLQLCRDNNVSHTPFFRYVYRNSRGPTTSVPVDIPDSLRTVEGMRSVVAANAAMDNAQSHAWPMLEPVDPQTTLDVLWASVPNAAYLVVVLDDKDTASHEATQLLLSMSGYSAVVARRVRSASVIATQVSGNQVVPTLAYPKVALLQRGIPNPRMRPQSLTRDTQSQLLSSMQAVTLAPALATTTPATSYKLLDDDQRASLYYVSESDMLLAVRESLYNEVLAFRQTIAGDDLIALKKWLSILKDYFPIANNVNRHLRELQLPQMRRLERSERARQLFLSMYAYVNEVPSDGEITIAEYQQQFEYQEALHSNPFPGTDAPYTHCKGSEPKFRGYTCGLWTAFHAITVQAFLSRSADMALNPRRPLYAIQQWVDKYFSCDFCSEHFTNMTTYTFPIITNVAYPSQTVLYLWKAHNIVNKRLSTHKRTEDPMFPKKQFPMDFLCDSCRASDDEWYEYRVLNYLIQYYTSIQPSAF